MEPIVIGSDYEIEVELRSRNSATGSYEPRTGATVEATLRAPDGTALTGLAGLPLAERSGNPGHYYVVIDAADLAAALADRAQWPDGSAVIVEVAVPGDLVFRERVKIER